MKLYERRTVYTRTTNTIKKQYHNKKKNPEARDLHKNIMQTRQPNRLERRSKQKIAKLPKEAETLKPQLKTRTEENIKKAINTTILRWTADRCQNTFSSMNERTKPVTIYYHSSASI